MDSTLKSMDLSIIIVNWKSIEYLCSCLKSIYSSGINFGYEIIVVENASGDPCEETLRQAFPEVNCILSAVNLGFAGANNLGFSHSTGRNILYLNPDTEIVGQALQVLCKALDESADGGAVGARLLNTDGTVQLSSIQAFPTILNQVLDSDFLRTRFRRARLWGMRPLYDADSKPAEVDVISGACIMIKRHVIESVGGFSKNYFMYSEDVDLCWRIKRAGWKRYYLDSAAVIHHGGCSSAKEARDNFAAVLIRESKVKLLTTWRGRGYANAYRAATALAALCRLAVLNVVEISPSHKSGRSRRKQATAKWTKILRWALGFEGWAEQLRDNSR